MFWQRKTKALPPEDFVDSTGPSIQIEIAPALTTNNGSARQNSMRVLSFIIASILIVSVFYSYMKRKQQRLLIPPTVAVVTTDAKTNNFSTVPVGSSPTSTPAAEDQTTNITSPTEVAPPAPAESQSDAPATAALPVADSADSLIAEQPGSASRASASTVVPRPSAPIEPPAPTASPQPKDGKLEAPKLERPQGARSTQAAPLQDPMALATAVSPRPAVKPRHHGIHRPRHPEKTSSKLSAARHRNRELSSEEDGTKLF